MRRKETAGAVFHAHADGSYWDDGLLGGKKNTASS